MLQLLQNMQDDKKLVRVPRVNPTHRLPGQSPINLKFEDDKLIPDSMKKTDMKI